MYNPPAFAVRDPEALRAMLREARLAILVSTGADGAPEATHLPLHWDPEGGGEWGVLHGHLARANAHWKGLAAAGRALAILPGPEAYVSPSNYAAKREHGRVVPTWNYVALHAAGPVEVFDDADRLHRLVSLLTDRHEARRADPWAVTDAPEPFVAGQLKGIVGLTLRIERLEGKRKLSQNRSEADRAGVVADLAASADPGERAVAAAMQAVASS